MESVEVNGGKIEYSLIRKDVKNINLRVKRDGSVVVSASPVVPKAVISTFICDNAEKIFTAVNKNKAADLYSFEAGSRLMLLGKEYSLILESSRESSYFVGENDITFFAQDVNNNQVKKDIYNKLLRNTAEIVFLKLMKECYHPFEKVCKSVPELKIKDLKSQWGNCYHKNNRITLNLRLAVYDFSVIKSVIYHEYCHFVYQNHSKDFYNLLSRVCPDWKECDRILKNKK